MANKKSNFEPLIKNNGTTLQDKEVDIKDTMNFERTANPAPVKTESKGDLAKKAQEEKIKKQKTTMKTQKMSLDVMLKLEILEPFMRGIEHMDDSKKISINDKIEILIDSYLHTKLSSHQMEGFKAVYDTFTKE